MVTVGQKGASENYVNLDTNWLIGLECVAGACFSGGCPMYFNVSQLLKEPSGASRRFEIDQLLAAEKGTTPERVRGSAYLLRTDKGIWVSAVLESEVTSVCSRCLLEHWQPVLVSIDEEFLPVVDVDTGARLSAPTGEEGSYIDQNHILDLAEPTRQYLLLSTPMKPVCSEDCAGICPGCGVNLNESACLCKDPHRDLRWGALLELVPAEDGDIRS